MADRPSDGKPQQPSTFTTQAGPGTYVCFGVVAILSVLAMVFGSRTWIGAVGAGLLGGSSTLLPLNRATIRCEDFALVVTQRGLWTSSREYLWTDIARFEVLRLRGMGFHLTSGRWVPLNIGKPFSGFPRRAAVAELEQQRQRLEGLR